MRQRKDAQGNENCLRNKSERCLSFLIAEREKEFLQIIREEKLKEPETRAFLGNAFRDGEIKTTGTDIDRLLPPVSRFGGGGARARKKQTVIDKLKKFFEKFSGISEPDF